MNVLSPRGVRTLVSASLLFLLSGCQATSLESEAPNPTVKQPLAALPSGISPSRTPQVMTFPTLRAVARASGVAPQTLILTGIAQTQDVALRTPRPPWTIRTPTPDLRPTTTPNFDGLPHRWTDVGVIFPRWPDDLGMVCYKTIDPPEGLLINNYWSQWDGPDEKRVYVYAGATANSAAGGLGSVMVAYTWDPCTWEEYITPEPTGPLEITDARGHILQLESQTSTYYFNIDSRVFVSSFLTPTPPATTH